MLLDTQFRSKQYEQLGVELVENSPEEITVLAVEMDERLKRSGRLPKRMRNCNGASGRSSS